MWCVLRLWRDCVHHRTKSAAHCAMITLNFNAIFKSTDDRAYNMRPPQTLTSRVVSAVHVLCSVVVLCVVCAVFFNERSRFMTIVYIDTLSPRVSTTTTTTTGPGNARNVAYFSSLWAGLAGNKNKHIYIYCTSVLFCDGCFQFLVQVTFHYFHSSVWRCASHQKKPASTRMQTVPSMKCNEMQTVNDLVNG